MNKSKLPGNSGWVPASWDAAKITAEGKKKKKTNAMKR
jgi:hypothetical protein